MPFPLLPFLAPFLFYRLLNGTPFPPFDFRMREFYFKAIRGEKGFFYSFLRTLLFFFELIYFLLVKSRFALYRAKIMKEKKISQKVVSIGNITTGGTGKTPMVILIAKMLKERGKKVCILSRGYKRRMSPACQSVRRAGRVRRKK